MGMTSAISVAEPKPSDLTRTNELKEALKPYNVFESEEELNHRMEILRCFSLYIYVYYHTKYWVLYITLNFHFI